MPEAASTLAALLLPLAVIGAFWLAALYLTRKFRRRIKLGADSARSPIRIIATKPIAWQTSLFIVEAEGQRFLISAGRAGLTPIGALNRPASPLPAALTIPFPESAH